MTLILIDRAHPLRDKAEALIADVYLCEYGAEIKAFSDLLIAIPGQDDELDAVAGLRIGGNFFSEVYLEGTIEQELSKHWQPPADRATIAEVTTLASRSPRSTSILMSNIIGYLRSIDMRFAFFTVTERLYALLRRNGAPAQELALARPDKLSSSEGWGSYYASSPRVVAIHDAFVTMPAIVPFVTAARETEGKAAIQNKVMNIA